MKRHPRDILRRYLPKLEELRHARGFHLLGARLHDPELWHLSRRSTAMAAGVGLFLAFIPVPFQMVLAAVVAVIWRFNLPVAVVAVWLTNPLTMAPVYYGCYRLGAWLLGQPPQPFHFELSWAWLQQLVGGAWQPLALGTLVVGVLAGLTGHTLVRLLWRLHLVRRWEARRARRRAAAGEINRG